MDRMPKQLPTCTDSVFEEAPRNPQPLTPRGLAGDLAGPSCPPGPESQAHSYEGPRWGRRAAPRPPGPGPSQWAAPVVLPGFILHRKAFRAVCPVNHIYVFSPLLSSVFPLGPLLLSGIIFLLQDPSVFLVYFSVCF